MSGPQFPPPPPTMGPGGMQPQPGLPPGPRRVGQPTRRAASPARAIVAVAVLLVVLVGAAGGTYYFLTRGKARYRGTWELRTIEAMGRSLDAKEFGKTVAQIAGPLASMLGRLNIPETLEAKLTLRRDGTGEVTGNLVPLITGTSSDTAKVNWTYKDGKAELRLGEDASSKQVVCQLSEDGKTMSGNTRAQMLGMDVDIGVRFAKVGK